MRILDHMRGVKELYEAYGFKTFNSSNDHIIFIYDQGYFKNAEIVKFSDVAIEDVKKDLLEIGYNPNVTTFKNIEEIQNRLFEGFFKVSYYKSKVSKDYKNFKQNQSILLGSDYEYIRGNYYKDTELQHDDIVNKILEELNEEGPRLIVLEAAAGYGKTCTVYEIFNEIVNLKDTSKIPLMSELSRNRKAKIFRYILLDEIDKKFPGLQSDLVESEIYSGKIPLIVDGFDELLIKSHDLANDEAESSFDDIETMLGTIGEMLRGNAKIILTSRKSALLSGDKFFEWINNRENEFSVSKYTLNEPSIRDWIGPDKIEVIERLGNDAESLLNPVILAFIKNLDLNEFTAICNNIDQLIDNYFSKLLERERIRQNLKIETREQLEIFQGLANYMSVTGITSDSRESIKSIISNDNWVLIEKARSRYLDSEKPDFESIANTLAGHVLLDRNGSSDRVGFINEFIFGILLGNSMCDSKKIEVVDMKFIDMVCTSFKIRSQEKRNILFQKILPLYDMLLEVERLEIDTKLKNSLTCNYKSLSLNGNLLDKFNFGSFKVSDSVFYSCIFSNMLFCKNSFSRTSFIDCKFYNCEFVNDTDEDHEIYFISCNSDTDYSTLLDKVPITDASEETIEQLELKYEKIVIEQFWPPGKAGGQPKRAYRTLFNGVDYSDFPYIEEAINRLRKRGILRRESDIYIIDYSEIKEISRIRNS
ncbi:hypothetical protein P4H83_21320 [Paenibacillus favisporus]|uniref:hypothetical protein n=1 Tax=Paenibacillus favisporus TaxID=221028 RepID=UPI002DBAC52D|nr:hypothetical protein [Paenibacillus favisporus]MEC0177422.1 hypothetical protein [Paenibacillus favisporus]